MPKVFKIRSLHTLQYHQINMGDEVDFLPAKNAKVFYKVIVSLSVCVGRLAQSTKNNKFAISAISQGKRKE